MGDLLVYNPLIGTEAYRRKTVIHSLCMAVKCIGDTRLPSLASFRKQ